MALLEPLRSGETAQTVSGDMARVRKLYDDILRERYDQAEPRLADLDQLDRRQLPEPVRVSHRAGSRAALLDQFSRFLDRGGRDKMERVVVGTPDQQPALYPPAPPIVPIDLRAMMRALRSSPVRIVYFEMGLSAFDQLPATRREGAPFLRPDDLHRYVVVAGDAGV